MATPIVLAML